MNCLFLADAMKSINDICPENVEKDSDDEVELVSEIQKLDTGHLQEFGHSLPGCKPKKKKKKKTVDEKTGDGETGTYKIQNEGTKLEEKESFSKL